MPVDSIKTFLKICSPSPIPACRFTRGNTVTLYSMNDKTGDAYSGGGGIIFEIPPQRKILKIPPQIFGKIF